MTPSVQDTSATRRPRTRLGGYLPVLWAVAVAVALVDQATKAWAVGALADGHRVPVLGDLLGLVLLRNPGAAFSFATGQTWLFSLVALAVTIIILRISRRLASLPWAVTLGLILGGAVGNLIDRLLRSPGVLRGHVVDFIDYGGYFVGNVADIAIVVAAAAVMVLSLCGVEVDGTRAGTGDAGPQAPAADTSTPDGADGEAETAENEPETAENEPATASADGPGV